MHTEGCPPLLQEPMDKCPPKDQVKKQIRFYIDEDFGDDPILPNFLEGDSAKVWDNVPSPSIPLTMDPPQLPCNDGYQHHPTHVGGAHPKAPIRPSVTA